MQAAIAAHHAKLGFKYEDRWIKEGANKFWIALQKESNKVFDEHFNFEEIVQLQYEFAGPRGYLQLADHRASAIEDQDLVPPHKKFGYKFNDKWEKRSVQLLAENHWEDELLLTRAVTGAGKTDASLLWASKQIEHKKAERLVIAMPTRFTSNALAINVSENLSATGLYHSSAWFNQFQNDVEKGKITRKDANRSTNLPDCFKHLLQFVRLIIYLYLSH